MMIDLSSKQTERSDQWRAVAHRTAFLHERLTLGWISEPDNGEAAQRLGRWHQVLVVGQNQETWQKRLDWWDLDDKMALSLLGDGRLQVVPPEWEAWLTIVQQVCECPISFDGDDLSLEQLLKPFVSVGIDQLQQQVAQQDLLLLSGNAQQNLKRYLMGRLLELAAPTLNHLGLSAYFTQNLWEQLCQSYPVLVRQLATCVLQWSLEIERFLRRLCADWSDLIGLIGGPCEPTAACVLNIVAGLSDRHAGGQTVWQVRLIDNTAVAYKPKSLKQDQAWRALLTWCNNHGLFTQLDTLWVLSRDGYGWMEWGHHTDLEQVQHDSQQMRKTGMILSLVNCLRGGDIHQENLLFGESAVWLIDAEMIPYPQVKGEEAADPLSVLRTGLLPRWRVQHGAWTEIGGLASEHSLSAVARSAIQAGFQEMNRFLYRHWSELVAHDGPLRPFQQGVSRFGPRPTESYDQLLQHLRHPACLRSGADFSIELDRLACSYVHQKNHEQFWPLLWQEHIALTVGDIPAFSTQIGQRDLGYHDVHIENCLTWPEPLAPNLNLEMIDLGLIKASLQNIPYFAPSEKKLSFLTAASLLAEQLVEQSILISSDEINWAVPQTQPGSGLVQHQLLDDSFYQGRLGIALFFAALGDATNDNRWIEWAEKGIRPFINTSFPNRFPGDQLYGVGQLTTWLPATSQPLSKLCGSDLANPHPWGVIDGNAGLLLALLRCWQVTQQDRFKSQAIQTGMTIVNGLSKWTDLETGLGGFAHGAAGISYALIQLYRAFGDARFLDVARQGWAFQRGLYDHTYGLWEDRRGKRPIFLTNWCHGAAGIGLAAVGCLDELPELEEVVHQAANKLLTLPPSSQLDTLCCGRFGEIEALLEIGLRLNQQPWIDHAHYLAKSALANAVKNRYFQLYDDLAPRHFNASFFRGVAGIGYTLLRLGCYSGEAGATLPCLLGWTLGEKGGGS